MDTAVSRRYFGDARRSLKTTHNLFGKLCLLALIQFIPILGQIVALGYFLGWAREAAWRVEAPLPPHVFGAGDRDFWGRGAKAFAVELLYGLIVCLMCAVYVIGSLFAVHWFDLGEVGSTVTVFVCTLLCVGTCFLLGLAEVAGLLRLAVYNRFGAAFQWGACFKMLGREFGGMLKLLLTAVFLNILISIPAFVVAALLMPGALLTVLVDSFVPISFFLGDTAALPTVYLAGSVAMSALMNAGALVAQFLLLVVALMVEALLWRAAGNWCALFDVPVWGGRFDPLPFERPAAGVVHEAPPVAAVSVTGSAVASSGVPEAQEAAPEGAVPKDAPVAEAAAQPASAPAGEEPVPAPAAQEASVQPAPRTLAKRCHPLAVGVLCSLFAVVLAGATSLGTAALFEEFYDEHISMEEVERYFDDLIAEFEEAVERGGLDGLIDEFEPDFDGAYDRFVGPGSSSKPLPEGFTMV